MIQHSLTLHIHREITLSIEEKQAIRGYIFFSSNSKWHQTETQKHLPIQHL